MAQEIIIYKTIAVLTLVLWIGLWRAFFKKKFSIYPALIVLLVGVFLVVSLPIVVFACDVCLMTYALQHVILSTVIFFSLMSLVIFLKFILIFLRKSR